MKITDRLQIGSHFIDSNAFIDESNVRRNGQKQSENELINSNRDEFYFRQT